MRESISCSAPGRLLPLLISVIPFGLILGALSADKGLSPLETMLMSGLVFAGSAQFVAAGLWHHPLPVLAIVASTALINSRHLLMGAALESHMRQFGRARGYAALFFPRRRDLGDGAAPDHRGAADAGLLFRSRHFPSTSPGCSGRPWER